MEGETSVDLSCIHFNFFIQLMPCNLILLKEIMKILVPLKALLLNHFLASSVCILSGLVIAI